MDPNEFVAEIYRRMSLRAREKGNLAVKWDDFVNDRAAVIASGQYESVLPRNKNARILDIGIGNGWFMSACVRLGYTDLYGADFGAGEKMSQVCNATSSIKGIFDITTNIGDFLAERNEKYDFIHLSHVIEHIPKYSLLYVTDALYKSLNRGGVLFLRTPNMEAPCALSSLYVTLGHEYGFCGSNLVSLLSICGFDDIRFHNLPLYQPTVKQRLGQLVRKPFILCNMLRHRLFGVNHGGQFGPELVVSGRRGDFQELFNEIYR